MNLKPLAAFLQALIRVSVTSEAPSDGKRLVDIGCRVNVDELGQDELAVEYIWSQLSLFVIVTEHLLTFWPGLLDRVREGPRIIIT